MYSLNLVYDRLLTTYQACTANFMNSMINIRFSFKKKILEQNDLIYEKKTFFFVALFSSELTTVARLSAELLTIECADVNIMYNGLFYDNYSTIKDVLHKCDRK